MSTRMPNAAPVRDDSNIGRPKVDAIPPTNLDQEIPAREFEQIKLELIATAEAVIALQGSTATLQIAYNNGASGLIQTDNARGSVEVRGNSVAGLKVSNEAADTLLEVNGTTGSLGVPTRPTTNGTLDFGDSTHYWRSVFASRMGLRQQAVGVAAGGVTANARNGSLIYTLGSTAIGFLSLSNLIDGQMVVWVVENFTANAVAMSAGSCTPTIITTDGLDTIQSGASGFDVYVFVYSAQAAALLEIARTQTAPALPTWDVSAAAPATFKGSRMLISGTMGAATTKAVTLGTSVVGTKVELYLNDPVIPAGSTLQIKNAGGTVLKSWTNTTVTGVVVCVCMGADDWRVMA